MADGAINAWRRFGVVAAFCVGLPLCALLIVAQRSPASALCIVVAFGVLIEGVALMTNWQGVARFTAEQSKGALGDVLKLRTWEVRVMMGGFFVFCGALFIGGGITYL